MDDLQLYGMRGSVCISFVVLDCVSHSCNGNTTALLCMSPSQSLMVWCGSSQLLIFCGIISEVAEISGIW